MSFHDVRVRFPELANGAAVLFGGLAAASRPAEDLTISEFSDRHRKVSPESGSPWPGDFRTDRVPYLREPQDCLHPDHPARRVTCRWAAQLGKSTAIENWFCFIVDQSPGSMMIVLPTLEEATKFNRIKLQPTIEASKRIAHKVLPVNSRDEQGSTTSFKRFAGGFCQIVNAGSSKGLQMVSIKYLAMDEVTGYPKDVDGRGSPRDQARARQKMYGDLAKEWQGSTPGIAGECAISEDFESGDQRFRYMPCPHCDTYQPIIFDMMRGPDKERGLPVHVRCMRCDGVILDGHKREMEERAHWIARRVQDDEEPVPLEISAEEIGDWICPPCEGRCRDWQPSYHLWAAYAIREKWADIWQRWIDAQGDTTKLKTFYQQDLAEPYDPGSTTVEWEKIVKAARDEMVPTGIVPEWAALLVSAADVQGYGIKWVVYAIGPREQYCLIDREIFEGSPDQSDEPWIQLSDALNRTYLTSGGREKAIDLSGIDSGWSTDRVYRFCVGRPNVIPLDGREPVGLPWLGTPVKKDVKDHRKKVIAKVLLYPVGLYDVKTAVTAALANLVQGASEVGQWPRGTIHFAGDLCDEDFAKELTAECLVDEEEEARTSLKRKSKRLVNPKAGRKWKKINGRMNDWFDATVYSYALGWYLQNKRKLTLDRWADLIRELHGEPEQANDLFDLADLSPFGKQEQKPAQPSGKPRQRKRWGSYS
ncbi:MULTISPECIES: terminase gpA endonuclease subunit [Rhizobium]|uniref:Phage terminase large subunit GpA-like protein n=1 Tax=Rhizobium tropici TaxID=398 RepID=A0ABR6R4H1_RHITR|nr:MULTISPECIES: terminase gpA endonuclease subunit [Rhizobium]AGB71828.1 phage terminase large subunit (GpA) [Rhizobium tropici CIAT 899]MBB4243723.1 phage terminase large subunit GpA-like protein [Rhizobium tropici]MBB5593302.1 phage terminase large subunit GpA-like protein [Rhizobium tropici]MBB6494063.1 phage terminase large subunit GpA-like protein [Rhizobium tropici]